jgi:EAL domain-containing protein (putative c-di-GMP-specific phosphodiesterase class I)
VAGLLPDFDPDLVLVDLHMPRMDGFDVIAQVQAYAAARFLPLIVLTADDTPEAINTALALGAHDYIMKPFGATEMVLRVRNLLLHRAAHLELRRSRVWLADRLGLFERLPAIITDEPERVVGLVRDVLDNDAIRIALQPVLDMTTDRIVGFEALSRFPAGPLGGPDGWFIAAHQVGMARELELAAVSMAAGLLPQLPTDAFLAVNVSPAVLVSGLLERLGADAPWSRLVIEVTEHVPVEDYPALARAATPLRQLGARLSVDDAGAGFASLRHILDLAPDIIKIDIGLVRGIDKDPSREAMTQMIVNFADRMGIAIIAEGVETEGEKQVLLALGVRWGQGYLLGRPALVDDPDGQPA